jgi:hypothetical protein
MKEEIIDVKDIKGGRDCSWVCFGWQSVFGGKAEVLSRHFEQRILT